MSPPGVFSPSAALRARGRRITRQRVLIWQALLSRDGSHVDAATLAEALPGLSAATVYRTLDLLVEEGLVKRTDLGTGRGCWELVGTGPGSHAHHHVVCNRCGRVEHIHDEALGDLAGRIRAASGYFLGPDEITFRGFCDRCAI